MKQGNLIETQKMVWSLDHLTPAEYSRLTNGDYDDEDESNNAEAGYSRWVLEGTPYWITGPSETEQVIERIAEFFRLHLGDVVDVVDDQHLLCPIQEGFGNIHRYGTNGEPFNPNHFRIEAIADVTGAAVDLTLHFFDQGPDFSVSEVVQQARARAAKGEFMIHRRGLWLIEEHCNWTINEPERIHPSQKRMTFQRRFERMGSEQAVLSTTH